MTTPVKILRFVTLVLAALAMGLEFAHLLELPAKMRYDAQLYWAVQHTLYYYFAVIGGPVEVGAVLATGALALLVRRRKAAFRLASIGAGFVAAALVAWFALVAPANVAMAAWAPGAMPPDWTHVRALWEHGHAVGAALLTVGFCALLLSVLADTPTGNPPEVKSPEHFAAARTGRVGGGNPGDSR